MDLGPVLSCIYVCVFTILIDLALCLVCSGFVCLDVSFLTFCFAFIVCVGFFPFCLVLSISPVLWDSGSPKDPSCSPWELWPIGWPDFLCGAGSSGGTLSAINVAPCVFR